MNTNTSIAHSLRNFLRPQMLLMLFFVALSVAACKKDDDNDDDDDGHSHSHGTGTYEATIAITSPDQSMYMNGDNVDIKVSFTNDATIHNVSVKLINLSNNDAEEHAYEMHVHEEDGAYEYTHSHTFSVTGHTDYRLEAKTWDHGSEAEAISKTFEFHVMP